MDKLREIIEKNHDASIVYLTLKKVCENEKLIQCLMLMFYETLSTTDTTALQNDWKTLGSEKESESLLAGLQLYMIDFVAHNGENNESSSEKSN